MGKYGKDYSEECRERKEPVDDLAELELCSDCPPVGYPTDKTRCLYCPRRAPNSNPVA